MSHLRRSRSPTITQEGRQAEMPLHGVFSGRRADVRLICETVLHFPEDKEVRDPAHARLAKKIAARKALKEQSAVVSVASPGKGEHVLWPLYQFARKKQLELELAFRERMKVLMYIQSELMHLGVQEPLLESAGLSAATPGTGEQAN